MPRCRDVRSAVTSQSPELGDWLQTTTCLRLPSSSKTPPPGCCATARTLLRTPTTGAATPPASALPPQSLASSHSCRRARPASAPTVSNPYPAPVDFHERAAPCQAKSFGRLSNNRGSPTLREARCSVPTIFLPQKGFSAFRRFALLPFALLSGAFAPVPVGILNLKSGAAISVPN